MTDVRDGVCLRCGSGVLRSGEHVHDDRLPCALEIFGRRRTLLDLLRAYWSRWTPLRVDPLGVTRCPRCGGDVEHGYGLMGGGIGGYAFCVNVWCTYWAKRQDRDS